MTLALYCTQALVEAVAHLTPAIEAATGHSLAATFGTTGGLVKRLKAGEAADVVIVARSALEGLAAAGLVADEGRADIARVGLGIAVRAGGPVPDISTVEALTATLAACRSVAYPDPADGGASGVHFAATLERLGLAEALAPRSILVKAGGEVGVLAAEGKAELAVQMISELMPIAGTVIAGPLPDAVQNVTQFSAGVTAASRQPKAARALIAFLGSAAARPALEAAGLSV